MLVVSSIYFNEDAGQKVVAVFTNVKGYMEEFATITEQTLPVLSGLMDLANKMIIHGK